MIWLLPIVILSSLAIIAWIRGLRGLATGLVVGGAILLRLLYAMPPLGGGMIGWAPERFASQSPLTQDRTARRECGESYRDSLAHDGEVGPYAEHGYK